MQVSVIIVSFNTQDLTLQAIASIYTHTMDIDFEVIVVDNASTDGSVAAIRAKYPELILIEQQENIGFGRANNVAMRIAKGKYYFLLNSDAYITDNALKSFYEYMELHPQVAVAGGALQTGNETETMSYGNFPNLIEATASMGFFVFFKSYYKKHLAAGVINTDEKIKEVDYITGADMFLRASVIDQIGMFDEDFFMYFEDTELCYRIKKAGYKSVILPYIVIIHLVSAYRDALAPINYAKVRLYEASRKLYYRKCYGNIAAGTSNVLIGMQHLIWGVLRPKKGVLKKTWIALTT